ncbi:MAG: DUF1772 domain-containing protein [Proteobacteria bacterium]|nr:DUF1772 domain-containing protein [Pseudomonadota bacterium]
MTDIFVNALTILATLGSGLVAGIFFAFSAFLMTALGRIGPDQGISAMQSINIAVLNPWFFGVFFGTALGSIALAIFGVLDWGTPGSAYLVTGSLLYLIGCIMVTIVFNVPLNNALAAVEPDSNEGSEMWTRYLSTWTAWNHVRTAASFAAAATFIMAIR